MDFVEKINKLSEQELLNKTRIHRNSNIFLLVLWLAVMLMFYFSPIETCEFNNEGASLHGCGMPLVAGIALIIGFIIFFASAIEGINGIKLFKVAKTKLQNKFTLLGISSYLLVIPSCLFILGLVIVWIKKF